MVAGSSIASYALAHMVVKVLSSLGLLAVTVALHSIGLVVLLRWVLRSPAMSEVRIASSTWLLIRVVWGLLTLHVLEIAVWGAFYQARGALPDLESALYFSGVTYATIGYGDVLLPHGWRYLAPIEGLAGILMCGLSTGFFFAMMHRIHFATRGWS